ncbi:ATP-binding protein [Streptomyces sp. DASNCL29]|uniref:ATP-binding protein n=1 Tax=Streptomyces sp. DASNCL29 TaxID=2583819 RepID=UPI001F10034E|nr:ATP-binding protein [Streptomyces sp. DASNCL29]
MPLRTAREAVRTALHTAKRTDLTDTALLLTSEAVTNAVNACRTSGCSAPVTLYAEWGPYGTLRVLVSDDAPGLPAQRSLARDTADAEMREGSGLVSLTSGQRDGWVPPAELP